jgi:hypothetical protein
MDCLMIYLIVDAAQSWMHHMPSMAVIDCISALSANFLARKLSV